MNEIKKQILTNLSAPEKEGSLKNFLLKEMHRLRFGIRKCELNRELIKLLEKSRKISQETALERLKLNQTAWQELSKKLTELTKLQEKKR